MKIFSNFCFVLFFALSMPFGCLWSMKASSVTEGSTGSAAEPRLFNISYAIDSDLKRECKTATYNPAAGILTDQILSQEARKPYLADVQVLVIAGAPNLHTITDPWQNVVVPTRYPCWRNSLSKIEVCECANLNTLDVAHCFNLNVLRVGQCDQFVGLSDMSQLRMLMLLVIDGCGRFVRVEQLPVGLRRICLVACPITTFPNMRELHELQSFEIVADENLTTTANLAALISQLPRELVHLEVDKYEDHTEMLGAAEPDFTVFPNMHELSGLRVLEIKGCPIDNVEQLPLGLQRLKVSKCPRLRNIHYNTPGMRHLVIEGCPLLGPDRNLRRREHAASASAAAPGEKE